MSDLETKVNTFSHLMNPNSKKQALPVKDKNIQVSDNEQYIPEPYKKVARGMEEQFANFMLEEMNKTTGNKDNDSASQFYKGLMTSERAKTMSESTHGLGLKKVILDQIYPQRLRNKIAHDNFMARENAQHKQSKIEMYRNTDRALQLDEISKATGPEEGKAL